MIGAIAGDMIGSIYEFLGYKHSDFPLFQPASHFTDDSVLTIALAESILTGEPYVDVMREYVYRYPTSGYGGYFSRWIRGTDHTPYNSYGNGAAMRISPVAYAWDTLQEVLDHASEYTGVTHNHPEGIKGGQATAAAIFLARCGESKETIKGSIRDMFGYNLDRKLDDIRPTYRFDETCQGTVPEAIIAFLESNSFEHAVRLAVSLGGDADTLACITGSIAEPFYGGVPEVIAEEVHKRLDPELNSVVLAFHKRFSGGVGIIGKSVILLE